MWHVMRCARLSKHTNDNPEKPADFRHTPLYPRDSCSAHISPMPNVHRRLCGALFGRLKGSFTSAHETKIGKFQKADGGTIFLDEVGDMSLRTQAKVLRAGAGASV